MNFRKCGRSRICFFEIFVDSKIHWLTPFLFLCSIGGMVYQHPFHGLLTPFLTPFVHATPAQSKSWNDDTVSAQSYRL
jgi:hypothetical protein